MLGGGATESGGGSLSGGEVVGQRDGAGIGDRPARRLGEVHGRLEAGQLRRLDQRVEERRDARPAFRAGPVMVLETADDRTHSELARLRLKPIAGVVQSPLQPFPEPEGVRDRLTMLRARQY